MSKNKMIELECLFCKEKGNYLLWDSINVTVDPQIKEKALNLSLFDYKCEKCNSISRVNHDSLYHDMDNKFMVYLLEDQSEAAVKKLNEAMIVSSEYHFRLVDDHNQMKEKIHILESKLNDATIELVKSQIFKDFTQEEKANMIGFYFLEKHEDGLVFIVVNKDNNQSIKLPISFYDGINRLVSDIEKNIFVKVDSKTAIHYVNNLEN